MGEGYILIGYDEKWKLKSYNNKKEKGLMFSEAKQSDLN